MAFYTRGFGDCATCEDVFPGPATPGDVLPPVPTGPGPVTSTSTSIYIDESGNAVCRASSRWWLWLLIGLGIGYLANE